MGVVVTPSELNVNPVLLRGGAVHNIPIERNARNYDGISYMVILATFIFMLPLDILELNISIKLSHILGVC